MDLSKKWTIAAVWKWCDLDGHPNDNVVSRHELFPVRAPLQVLVKDFSNYFFFSRA